MKKGHYSTHAVAALLALAAMAAFLSYFQTQALTEEIRIMNETQETPNPVLTTTWVSTFGTHTLTTTREDGETDAQHTARHKAAVVAAQDPETGFPPKDG